MQDYWDVYLWITFFPIVGGLQTVGSVFILPILWAMLAAGTLQGRWNSLAVMLGFAVSFVLFTLSLAVIVYANDIAPESVRVAAIVLLLLLGIGLIAIPLSSRFPMVILFGIALGLVYAFWIGPFKGLPDYYEPKAVDGLLIYVTSVFILAVAVPLFLVVTAIRLVLASSTTLSGYARPIQRVCGVLTVLTAVAIATHWLRIPLREEFIHPAPYVPLHELFKGQLQEPPGVLDILKYDKR